MSESRVWWSPPGSTEIYTIEPSNSGTSCFHFTPFKKSETYPTIEIRGHVLASTAPIPGIIKVTTPFDPSSTDQTEHLRAVSLALSEISDGKLDKVVVARVKSMASDCTPEATFKLKCQKHPDAFVYLIKHPECGVWCGATPELLISASDNRIETVSLAGTRVINGKAFDEWTDKERSEQSQVTEYIKSVLEDHGASDMSIEPRNDRRYGNLLHLETRFRCYIKGDISILASDLHPTPAVGGRPLLAACDFINSHERIDRAFYSGFLGVETASGSAYYVNLRAAQWMVGGVRLFAGGGIVEGSVPEEEWMETEAKIDAIKATLA
jgi:isochorismate synthase